MNRIELFQRKKQNCSKTHEEMLNILGLKGIQNNIMLRLYLTPVRMAVIKNINNKC
jgi:hypothetical protein